MHASTHAACSRQEVARKQTGEDFADLGAHASQDASGVHAAQQQRSARSKHNAVHLHAQHHTFSTRLSCMSHRTALCNGMHQVAACLLYALVKP